MKLQIMSRGIPLGFQFRILFLILFSILFSIMGPGGCSSNNNGSLDDYSGSYTFYFPPPESANWLVTSEPLLCSLTQEIPDYGTAQFIRKPKQGMVFSMTVMTHPKHPGNARLISRTPTWREKVEKDRDLGTIPLVVSETPFYLHNGWARRLLLELERGMNPLFRYSDWADGRDQVNVMLSSINFMPAWQNFQRCEQGLLPYVFEDVTYSVFQYGVNQTKPGKEDVSRLVQLSEYIKLDPAVKRVQIDGYTDSKGFSRINLVVANKRVQAVKDYFISQGIDKKIILTKAHQEKNAKFTNRTPEGRRKNRRVEINLLK